MFIGRISDGLMRVESFALKSLMAGLLGLILLNVVTRSLSFALYWVDEAAIYCMIWIVFMGASVAIRRRQRIAVTLLYDMVGAPARHILNIIIDTIILGFAAFLLSVIWLWFDPLTLAQLGFDLELFSAETFNFIYEEPTNTIGIRKVWIWSILPLFALTTLIHALANLIETLRGQETLPDHQLTEGLD